VTGGRRWLALVAVVLLAPAVHARQDWRTPALASFDDVWRTVADTFYDPTFGGLDWNAVRVELRPKAEGAESADAVRRVIAEMLGRLKRSHFVLLSSSPGSDDVLPGEATLPIDIRVIPAGVVITHVEGGSAAQHAGLAPGQMVVAVDGYAIPAGPDVAPGADARAQALDLWRRVFRALHGAGGSVVEVRVRDQDGLEKSVHLARVAESGETVTLGNLPPLHVRVSAHAVETPGRRRVGVITFNIWMPAVDGLVSAAVDTFRHADGLVFDLRGNPGGLAGMIQGIAGHILAEPALLGRMQTREGELKFAANPRRATPDGRRVDPYAGPVAILVDELTGSASECFAGALQSLGRARIFGRETMGQALPAVTKRLPNGDVFMYALGDFVTGTGRRLEGEGVVPDQIIPLGAAELAALSAGRDPVVEAAVRWLDGLAARPTGL
jgi:carboxyl-terminal processing protease